MKDINIESRIKKIKLIIMDVDGVLTDGRLFYDEKGNEYKIFNVMDGSGMLYAHRSGLKLVILSGNFSHVVVTRAKIAMVDDVYQNVIDKKGVLDELLEKYSLSLDEICYIGDDLVDIPVMMKIGFPVAVANADDEVKKRAVYVTEKSGGEGAVREVIEYILKVQGKWEKILNSYL